jgi:hypothetical protein
MKGSVVDTSYGFNLIKRNGTALYMGPFLGTHSHDLTASVSGG